jgi:rubrerythrin
MKTSQQWWNEVKQSPALLKEWLTKQFIGEVTAAGRIEMFADKFRPQHPVSNTARRVLLAIARQERQHADWVATLLDSRGIKVDAEALERAEDRYWKETLPGITDFETGTAVAAHAEGMRLERIRVICNDDESPEDIRLVFKRILKDEEWHEATFTALSTPEALAATKGNHELGLKALGLEA